MRGNEKIDDFIQEMQLIFNNDDDKIFEWVPYNRFVEIKEKTSENFLHYILRKWKMID